jgi:hypothetical protein
MAAAAAPFSTLMVQADLENATYEVGQACETKGYKFFHGP